MAVYTRRALTNFISRSLSSPSSPSQLLRAGHAITTLLNPHTSRKFSTRPRTSSPSYSPLNDPSPNWSNRPPKETILLDGCDYEHWLVVLEFPDPKPSDEEMVNAYVKTLAHVVGSEEEAKKKIYSVCTSTYTGFGALIPEELSHKLKEVPGVLWVLPDSYLDVPNKDYGGDLFVDGKVIVRPQYHYDQRQTNTRRPRPRYDRRRETMPAERREPMQTGNWAPDQRGCGNQTSAATGQNSLNNVPPQQTAAGYQRTTFDGRNSFNNGAPGQNVPGAQPASTSGQNSFNREQFPNQICYYLDVKLFETCDRASLQPG